MTTKEKEIFTRLLNSFKAVQRDLLKDKYLVLGYHKNGEHEPIMNLVKDIDFDVVSEAEGLLGNQLDLFNDVANEVKKTLPVLGKDAVSLSELKNGSIKDLV